MTKSALAKDIFFNHNVANQSIKVAIVVGTFLNLINQGDNIIALDFNSINYYKFFLTYTVPFMVSTYTAISIKMKFVIGTKSIVTTKVICKSCKKSSILLSEDELIPLCDNCGVKTQWRISK